MKKGSNGVCIALCIPHIWWPFFIIFCPSTFLLPLIRFDLCCMQIERVSGVDVLLASRPPLAPLLQRQDIGEPYKTDRSDIRYSGYCTQNGPYLANGLEDTPTKVTILTKRLILVMITVIMTLKMTLMITVMITVMKDGGRIVDCLIQKKGGRGPDLYIRGAHQPRHDP